jgi:hypothetical protein
MYEECSNGIILYIYKCHYVMYICKAEESFDGNQVSVDFIFQVSHIKMLKSS